MPDIAVIGEKVVVERWLEEIIETEQRDFRRRGSVTVGEVRFQYIYEVRQMEGRTFAAIILLYGFERTPVMRRHSYEQLCAYFVRPEVR